MDVISSHQAGVREAVATSGTAMTELHLKKLSRLTNDIRLAYDADEAGVKAAERAIMMAGDLGIRLSVVTDYDGAKDPDELIQRGEEKWQKAVMECVPAMEWLLAKYEEKVDLGTGVGKREYSDVAMKMIRFVQDPVERRHYEQMVAAKLAVSVDDLEAKKVREGKKFLRAIKGVEREECGGVMGGVCGVERMMRRLEDGILAILLFGGAGAGETEVEIPEDEVRVAELELVFEENYRGWDEERLRVELAGMLERRKEMMVRLEREKLMEELEKAEDEEVIEEILGKLNNLR